MVSSLAGRRSNQWRPPGISAGGIDSNVPNPQRLASFSAARVAHGGWGKMGVVVVGNKRLPIIAGIGGLKWRGVNAIIARAARHLYMRTYRAEGMYSGIGMGASSSWLISGAKLWKMAG